MCCKFSPWKNPFKKAFKFFHHGKISSLPELPFWGILVHLLLPGVSMVTCSLWTRGFLSRVRAGWFRNWAEHSCTAPGMLFPAFCPGWNLLAQTPWGSSTGSLHWNWILTLQKSNQGVLQEQWAVLGLPPPSLLADVGAVLKEQCLDSS